MQIAREQVVDLLKYQGDEGRAAEAKSQLPIKVDPERDSEALASLGIDPKDLRHILPGEFGG